MRSSRKQLSSILAGLALVAGSTLAAAPATAAPDPAVKILATDASGASVYLRTVDTISEGRLYSSSAVEAAPAGFTLTAHVKGEVGNVHAVWDARLYDASTQTWTDLGTVTMTAKGAGIMDSVDEVYVAVAAAAAR